VIGTTHGKQLTDIHDFCKEFGAKFSLFAKIATKRIIRTARLKQKYVNVVRGTYRLLRPLGPAGWSIMYTFSDHGGVVGICWPQEMRLVAFRRKNGNCRDGSVRVELIEQ